MPDDPGVFRGQITQPIDLSISPLLKKHACLGRPLGQKGFLPASRLGKSGKDNQRNFKTSKTGKKEEISDVSPEPRNRARNRGTAKA